MYFSIFLRTAGSLALAALIGAQALDWAVDDLPSSAEVLGWSLLAAVVAGLIAVGWAFVRSPAETALGRAWRQAVQALLASPIAAAGLDSVSDVVALGDLIVPAIAASVIAFAISYLSNRLPAPASAEVEGGTAQDFIG